MSIKHYLIIFLLLLVSGIIADNPLFSGSSTNHARQDSITVIEKTQPDFWQLTKVKLLKWQKEIYIRLYREGNRAGSLKGILLLMVLSFSYGFLHALGPGHGKLFLTGFFFSKKATLVRSVRSGFLIGILHALSGTILVLILQFILNKSVTVSSEILQSKFQIISYLILLLLGIFLFLKGLLQKDQSGSPHRSLLVLILSIGLIPCPGAVMISVFGISVLKSLSQTLLLIFSMGLGMSIAISLFALLPSLAQKLEHPVLKHRKFRKIPGLLGSLLMIILASALLIANL